MNILKAFIIATISSAGAMVFGAVVLGIANIYLAGHGIDWPNQNFESGLTDMSPLGVLLFAGTIGVFLGVFVVLLRSFTVND